MPPLRRLNEAGLRRLTEFLDSLKTDTPQGVPGAILTHADTSEDIGAVIDVEGRTFGSRFAAAEDLHARLAGLRDVEQDRGLWAWLALFYFEELCPPGRGNRRRPGELARWIPDVTN